MLIDTHAHLTNPLLLQNIEQIILQAQEAGLIGVLCVGTSLEDSQQCVQLSNRFAMIRAAVGIHPNHCNEADEGDWSGIVELAKNPAVVALGETGLDRYWDDCPWEIQLNYFRRHIQLARETKLPIVIHMRDCADEMLEVLREESSQGGFRGVMHSFTGSKAIALGCLELGLHISFAGMITFKNSAELRGVAKEIPLDRLLIETDSPYLAPHPFRGQRPNRPDLVRFTLECLSGLYQITPDELSQRTNENARALFQCWSDPKLEEVRTS